MSSGVVMTSLLDASQIAETDSVTEDETAIAFLRYVDVRIGVCTSIPIHSGQEVEIGRDVEKCNYAIHDCLVSKRHFRIYSISYEDDETADSPPPLIFCEDLESTNGTYINGILIGILRSERVGYLLSHGDVIEIRPYWKFTFLQAKLSNLHEFRDTNQLHELRSFDSLYTVANRPLGSGQSCIVYLASEVGSTKQLACKVIDLRVTKQSCGRRVRWEDRVEQVTERKIRAQREIRLLSELNHPNIISLRKAFISKETIYMFLELAAGGDLFSYVQANDDRLEDYHSRIITRQIAIGLQFIHSKRIAHRDIKPENILITRRDIGLRVVLTDFGHALRSDATRIFRKGSNVGTSGYAAPELINQTDAGYTNAADMYSLGRVTLLTLTGTNIMPPMIEFSEMSETEIRENFPDDKAKQQLQMNWQELFPSAQSYLRTLLYNEPEKRMNASEALAHIWYTHPRGHPGEVENVYQRSIKFWMPRDKEEKVEEYFPGCGPALKETTKKRRDKLPDASASPYFNLDRHTQHRAPSKRKRILAELRESGSQFLVLDTSSGEDSRKPKAIANMSLQRDLPVIRSVPGNDLFGTNLTDVGLPSDLSLDGLALESSILVPPMEGEHSLSDIQDDSENIADGCSDVEFQLGEQANKRHRKESWDPEDKRLHEVAAKKLPVFCTAKVYKDAVVKERKAGLKSK